MRPGIKKTASLAVVFFTLWLAARYLLPLCFPFVLGALLALAAEPMVAFLDRRRVPRVVSAGIGVGMAFCFLALLVMLLCAFLLRELRMAARVLPDLENTAKSGISLLQGWLLELASHTPDGIQGLLQQNVTSFFSNGTALLDKAIRYVLGMAGSVLGHIPDSALSLGTAVISSFLISIRLPKIKLWLRNRLPGDKLRPMLASLKRMKSAVGGWLLAQLKLMGVTFSILTLGLVLLRIAYAPLWALAVSFVDALPVLGTGTVLMPWALICFLQGDNARAVGLLGIYAVISLTRSMLEPRLVGRHLGLDPLVTLMALYAGYKLWGVGGMILAPLLTVTILQAIPERKPEG
ncbi:MAG: sporulation integral membrane protein YtvI [Firmicutes bacterium]|nr:sporulation integral membrane protein YtvI [Bacillota bacterium]